MPNRKTRADELMDDFFDLVCWAVCVVIVFWFAYQLTGCTNTAQPLAAPAPKYQLTLAGTIDGVGFQGIAVGSDDTSHDIKITSSVPVNYFTMQSCHRSIQFTDVIKDRWYDWSDDSKSFTWTYSQAPTIEDTGDCLLRFCAFSNKVGQAPVSCAIVDFRSPRYTLGGTNICNGATGKTSGTAICHTQVGLLERFQFGEPVVMAPMQQPSDQTKDPYWITNQCPGRFLDANQTLFEYQMPKNECVVIFDTKAQPHRRAKLTAIPFDLPKYVGAP